MTALLLAATAGCTAYRPLPGGRVSLGGAQIAVELVASWLHDAKSYAFKAEQVSPVWLSQHGFENLSRDECDIACTDRPITSRELGQFAERKLRGYRVAFYGYALYVHPDNPLDSVFAKHLKLVFQRHITDWKQLAGRQIPGLEGPIQLYGPPKDTGGGMLSSLLARIFFAQPTWTVLDTDAEIVAAVAADPCALGFAGIGYDDEVRYLGLRMDRMKAPAFPSLEEIEEEDYGLAKVIYVYFITPPTPAVQAVHDYLFSDEGRAAIEATDLWAISSDRALVSTAP